MTNYGGGGGGGGGGDCVVMGDQLWLPQSWGTIFSAMDGAGGLNVLPLIVCVCGGRDTNLYSRWYGSTGLS